jgi:Predicted membrane protein (DUF2157)
MSHYRWLIDQIPEWEKSGLLPPDVAARMRAFAEGKSQTDGKGDSRVAQIAMGSLGALLVGAGVLALIAHNWDRVPRGVRITGSFVLMAMAQGLVAWVIHQGTGAPRWIKEAGGLFLVLAAGGCLALVSQIYNMGGDWPDFVFVWLLLAMPVMWVLGAHSCALFHLVCITVWTASRMDGWALRPWHDSPLLYPILLAATLIYWPGVERPRPVLPNGVRAIATLSALVGFCALADYAVRLRGGGSAGMWLFMLTFANVAMLPLSRVGIEERTARKPQVVLGGLGLLGMGFFYSTEWGARELGRKLQESANTPWCWVLIALFVIFAVVALFQRRWAVVAIGTLALVPLLSLAMMKLDAKPDLSWAFTIHLFLIGLVMILAEFFGSKGSPRFGALLITLLILVRMADSELPLMTKAIVFIVMGVAFIGFNIGWSRWKRGKEVAV